MPTRLRNVILGFITAVLVTISLYAGFEVKSFNDNTREIEGIYREQLDAILFSLNQFSQDIAERWKIEINEQLMQDSSETVIDSWFLTNNASIQEINVFKAGEWDEINLEQVPVSDTMLYQLKNYYRNNYQKIEPLRDKSDKHYLSWITRSQMDTLLVVLRIDPEIFIEDVLSTRMESVSSDQFNIAAIDSENNETIYSTGDIINFNKAAERSTLWLFPDYYIFIDKTGLSIQEIARQRLFSELVILVTVVIVIFLALFLVIRVVRKEIELATAKSDFVSNVTHEIKTPLALISLFAETLELGRVKSEEKRNQYYEIINVESNRLSRLINRILSFSKMEAGKRNYHFEKQDVCELVTGMLETYSYHLHSNGFTYELDCKSPVLVELDKESFTEVVLNLIDNAIKFSAEEKRIEVRVTQDQNSVFIKLKDFGIGISKEDRARIFDKFYRSESALTQKTKGTGLGLNLVMGIVLAHHGEINVDSEIGKWTEFEVKLPLNQPDKAE